MPKSIKQRTTTKALKVETGNGGIHKNLKKDAHHLVTWVSIIAFSAAIVLFVYARYTSVINDMLSMRY